MMNIISTIAIKVQQAHQEGETKEMVKYKQKKKREKSSKTDETLLVAIFATTLLLRHCAFKKRIYLRSRAID